MKTRSSGRIVAVVGTAVLVALAVAAFSGPAAAHTGDDGGHHHDGWMGTHDGAGGWMDGGLWFLWMLLWAVALIGLPVVAGYLALSRRGSGDGGTDDALDVLRRRYAQGEIDDEEFETRRRTLRGGQD
jgi:putative membrane protein